MVSLSRFIVMQIREGLALIYWRGLTLNLPDHCHDSSFSFCPSRPFPRSSTNRPVVLYSMASVTEAVSVFLCKHFFLQEALQRMPSLYLLATTLFVCLRKKCVSMVWLWFAPSSQVLKRKGERTIHSREREREPPSTNIHGLGSMGRRRMLNPMYSFYITDLYL